MDTEQIKKYLNFLNHAGITEFRLIDRAEADIKKKSYSIYQKNINESDNSISTIQKYDKTREIYLGLNARKCEGKSDADVEFITNIGHDIDSHESGPDGLEIAKQVALKIASDTITEGFEEPLIINSGYGYWIIHHIEPIENTAVNVEKIKLFGKKIKEKYETEKINVDSSVYNPSRIARVPGTFNLRDKNHPVLATILNNPSGKSDSKLREFILQLKIPTYQQTQSPILSPSTTAETSAAFNSFMDYCLTHKLPEGERHLRISRNIARYIYNKPNRELLKEIYCKAQEKPSTDLDNWLKNVDAAAAKNELHKYPFSIGELVNFTKKYKIPFDWKVVPEYQNYIQLKKSEELIKKKIAEEEKLEKLKIAAKDPNSTAGKYLNLREQVLMLLAIKKETEATELIVKEILKHEHISTIRDDVKEEVWIYDNGIRIPSGKTFIKEICRLILGDAYTAYIVNQVIAKIVVDTYIEIEKFFSAEEKEEIAVQNGILNIFARELKNFTPEKIFFNKLPIIYDPTKKCPNILTHLTTVLKNADEDLKVIQELFGYCLFKEHAYENFFIFLGEGRNGKGKTLLLLKALVGDNNCSAVPFHELTEDSFAIVELHRKLINECGDMDNRALKNTSTIKSLTGRDKQQANRKFQSRLPFTNYAKLVGCANILPRTTDLTTAFFDRAILLEFPYTFASKEELSKIQEKDKINYKLADPNIVNKLTTAEELSGLLNWSLNGLSRLIKQDDFSYSKSTEETKAFWIKKSDSLSAFVNENIAESYEDIITKHDFRLAYVDYCRKNKLRICTDKEIKNVLMNLFGSSDSKIVINHKQTACWEGIKFTKKTEIIKAENETLLKNSRGSQGSYHKSGYGPADQLPIANKMVTSLTTLTNLISPHIQNSEVDNNNINNNVEKTAQVMQNEKISVELGLDKNSRQKKETEN